MPEIILKTDMPDKAAKILIETLEAESYRLKYSVQFVIVYSLPIDKHLH